MAKWQNDNMLDAALNYVKNNATKVAVCTAALDSTHTYNMATQTPSSSGACIALSAGSSISWASSAIVAGDTSGRKLIVPQQSSLTVLGSGANSATNIAIVGSVSSTPTLLYVTTCTAQSLTAGNTVTVPSWDIELRDAS